MIRWKTLLLIGAAVIVSIPLTVVSAADLQLPAGPAVVTKSVTVTEPLISLTPDVVDVKAPTVTITVTQSVYQQEQAKKTAQTKKVAQKVAVAQPQQSPVDPGLTIKRQLAQEAASRYSINWKVLEAVWQVESGKAWQTSVHSSAGATGPCQFLPSTWRHYAQDGNGDGQKNAYQAEDCLYGAAQLLASNGAVVGDNTKALLAYNHSMSYVKKVLAIANSI